MMPFTSDSLMTSPVRSLKRLLLLEWPYVIDEDEFMYTEDASDGKSRAASAADHAVEAAEVPAFPERNAAERNREELGAIHEHTPFPMLVVDKDCRIREANRYASEVIGHPSAELLNLPIGAALCCRRAEGDSRGCGLSSHCEYCRMRQTILDTLATGRSHRRVEVEGHFTYQSNGTTCQATTLSVSTARLDPKDQVLVILQDISIYKEAERALVRTEKLATLGKLSAAITHEIKNPLAAMTNILFLLRSSLTEASSLEYVSLLERELQRLTQIAQLSLASQRSSSEAEEFDLSELLAEVVQFFEPKARQQHVTVSSRLAKDCSVCGSRGEIRQLVSNLLLNAIEATPESGRIAVHLYHARAWCTSGRRGCHLSIADTGSGIDSQHLSRIFEPFFTTKGDHGTGLGLWISKKIVERAGGRLRVRSKQHTGTCFSIFFPTETPTAA
jgi:signal transduction histidine kinase